MIFELVELITGVSNGGYIEVKLLTPIAKDAQIVENGAYFLLAELKKSEAEHNH
jgi:cobalt-zinc-cadmium efflux system membrane fusion protein